MLMRTVEFLVLPCFFQGMALAFSADSSRRGSQRASAIDTTRDEKDAGPRPLIDVSAFDLHRPLLETWLQSLSELQRSIPTWAVGDEVDMLRTLSSSELVQNHLEDLMADACCPRLFQTKAQKAAFDRDWRNALMELVFKDDPSELPGLVQGSSNGHPLRVQLVAVPPWTVLSLHVHAGIELDIPLVGTLYERKPKYDDRILIDKTVVASTTYATGKFGVPTGDIRATPTQESLKKTSSNLSLGMVLADYGEEGVFMEGPRISKGECLVNAIGSIHQSFTKEEPCLLWVLGTNIHVCFQPGNFRQRKGTECLENIDHLLG